MQLQSIIDEILLDKEIQDFVIKHNLDRKALINNLPYIMQYIDERNVCENCKGKKACLQPGVNLHPCLDFYSKKAIIRYTNCPYKQRFDDKYCEFIFASDSEAIINSDMYFTEARKEIMSYISKFFNSYDKGIKEKGMYISGKFGVGKTYILLNVAKLFSERKKSVVFCYYPDLVRKLKSSLLANDLEAIVKKLKSCDALFLDDLGAEVNTPFIRDEVLGPILQYRSQNNLPVFISSNVTFDNLYDHFSETSKDINQINASRICERIRLLTYEFKLNDRNYRN